MSKVIKLCTIFCLLFISKSYSMQLPDFSNVPTQENVDYVGEFYKGYKMANEIHDMHQKNEMNQIEISIIKERLLLEYDKAISYHNKLAKNGDSDSALIISKIYYKKAQHSHEKSDYIYSYAWLNISNAMGKEYHIKENGNCVTLISLMNDYKSLKVIKKNDLPVAKELTYSICLKIKECNAERLIN